MIGALIGDLAAWTYEHDNKMFFKQLVPVHGGNAELSVYGKALLNAASHNLLDCPWIKTDFEETKDRDKYVGQWLMWQIVAAWKDTDKLEAMPDCYALEKEEAYAKRFIKELLHALRHGSSKSEAYYSTWAFDDLSKTWKWKTKISTENIGLLTYIFRAWDSFYRAFDYTSTIHNAVKWPGDKHLTAAIAGAFADAMYGCEMSYIKKKYSKDLEPYHFIDINEVGENNGYHHGLIREMFEWSFQERTFFPKNCALTNVELHNWQPVLNIFENISFNEEEYKRVLLSARTDWDCRYGLYLDDGWIYVYRSHVLIGRLQLKKLEEQWFVINPQLSGEMPFKDFCIALRDALYEGCRVVKYDLFNTIKAVDLCKYFGGELEMPSKWKHKVKGNFWYGEMMFCKGHLNIEKLTKDAEQLKKKLKGDKLSFANQFTSEQFALIIYIETLYGKCNPYDSLEWILDY